jgi:hypothetical protein
VDHAEIRARLEQARAQNAAALARSYELLAEASRLCAESSARSDRLRRERYGARPAQRRGELGEDRQVGVEPDPLDATDAE